jgi:GGDEF domain-containing protein
MKIQLEMESARLENADLRRQRASQHCEIQRVERLASYDGLTGILNRRSLEERGGRVVSAPAHQSAIFIGTDDRCESL